MEFLHVLPKQRGAPEPTRAFGAILGRFYKLCSSNNGQLQILFYFLRFMISDEMEVQITSRLLLANEAITMRGFTVLFQLPRCLTVHGTVGLNARETRAVLVRMLIVEDFRAENRVADFAFQFGYGYVFIDQVLVGKLGRAI